MRVGRRGLSFADPSLMGIELVLLITEQAKKSLRLATTAPRLRPFLKISAFLSQTSQICPHQ